VRRRLLVLLLALAALFAAAPGLARADSTPSKEDLGLAPDANAAIAVNTQDGSSLFKFAFAVRHVMSDVVDEQNAAVAYSQCESCQTTAIAIEIVLVQGHPSNVSPQNVAVAVNENCTLCDTFATAYQFVVGTDQPVRLTGRGIAELMHIRNEIKRWGREGLSNDEIKARLPAMIQRIKDVLATQLVPVRRGDRGDDDQNETDTTQTTPRASPTGPTSTTETGTVQTTETMPTDTTDTTTAPTDTTTTPSSTTTTPAATTTAPTDTTTTP
jgi:putative peptide zinc metalloprotease protein